MTIIKAEQNYKNVTDEWIKKATPNSHRVKDRSYFEIENGKRYYVDGKNVVLDYSKKKGKLPNG